MLYEAKVKFGLASGQPPSLWPEKNKHAPTHDCKLNQDVMYLYPASKKWLPATIVRLMDAKEVTWSKPPKVLGTEKHNIISSRINQEKLVHHQKSWRLATLFRVDPSVA